MEEMYYYQKNLLTLLAFFCGDTFRTTLVGSAWYASAVIIILKYIFLGADKSEKSSLKRNNLSDSYEMEGPLSYWQDI